jgi:hypothetical protein|tara:strand:+ start:365 stop:556 length:192 start_codon:yes stop_codon:yes gene_type:complete
LVSVVPALLSHLSFFGVVSHDMDGAGSGVFVANDVSTAVILLAAATTVVAVTVLPIHILSKCQ